jgi:ABC-type Fe3+-citrate transport system substrate-binding protein
MAKVVKDLKGEIEVNNTVVRFEIQVPKMEKTITLSDGTEKTIENITSPQEIARMLNEYQEGEEIENEEE